MLLQRSVHFLVSCNTARLTHSLQAFGLIIRTLNLEELEAPSSAQSKTYPLRLLIPHILIGSIIGQKGVRIREIQEASGARLNASESCLPLSTERSLVVLGVADAVHIATYYVGSTLVEQLTERFGGPAASAYATRSGGPAGAVPGGLQVVPYTPQAAGGQWGHPDTYGRHPTQQGQPRVPTNAYGGPQAQYGSPQPQRPGMQYGGGAIAPRPQQGYPSPSLQVQQPYGGQIPQQQMPPQAMAQPGIGGPAAAAAARGLPGQQLTQQIYIPNDMVGAIIGKGGAKINEIRQLSGSVIKINEPSDNSNERLVTITGTAECNQMALYMLYQRLGKSTLMLPTMYCTILLSASTDISPMCEQKAKSTASNMALYVTCLCHADRHLSRRARSAIFLVWTR
jgi:heterogeneous nuclear rnp K-like protein 2